jgi:SWIM zinc finger.
VFCKDVVKGAVYRLDEEVYLHSVERRGAWLVAIAYVRSQREKEVCYQVVLKLKPGTRYFVGHCECPDYKYRGGPCKHIVRAKVALREYLKMAKQARQ